MDSRCPEVPEASVTVTHVVDGAAAVRALAARLDVAYQPWVSGLTAAQRAAIVAWQGMDRHYEEIQAVLRGTRVATAAVSEEIGLLVQAVMGGRVPFEIPVWKGVRSVEAVFGAARPNVGLEVG